MSAQVFLADWAGIRVIFEGKKRYFIIGWFVFCLTQLFIQVVLEVLELVIVFKVLFFIGRQVNVIGSLIG